MEDFELFVIDVSYGRMDGCDGVIRKAFADLIVQGGLALKPHCIVDHVYVPVFVHWLVSSAVDTFDIAIAALF